LRTKQKEKQNENVTSNNLEPQNRELAFRKIVDEIMAIQPKTELDLYRLYAKDPGFYQAFIDTMRRITRLQ
jgi:type I restriction enzyme R subunit